ncbi:VOC family protein [Streptomyces sp. NPDC015346]|uniref:VOC family protein n=1 Tax=Streptomyces sp. NPDC015346 TaxID=3364954 RepID=UPI00370136F8
MAAFTEGTPCWVEAQLPDLEAGKRFYGELFGWTFDDERDEALSDGKRVAGLLPKRDGRMPTTWTVYLATEDAGVLSARIKAAGGRMIMEPYPVGRFGVMALAADPGGAVFGLRQAGDDDGFEKTMAPGSFCWMEVYTWEPDAVDTFYASVFGYLGRQVTAEEEGRESDFDYRVWSPPGSRPGDESAFGGRAVLTDAFPAEMPGHVLVYFAVSDCDETCATAVRLGGRVTNPPFDTPHGRIAVLHDNQGARFAVLAEPRDTREDKPADTREDKPADRPVDTREDKPADRREDKPADRRPESRPAETPAGSEKTAAERPTAGEPVTDSAGRPAREPADEPLAAPGDMS